MLIKILRLATKPYASIHTNTIRAGITFFLILLSLAFPKVSYADYISKVAANAYIYGLPLVLMEETQKSFTGPEKTCGLGADLNSFANIRELPSSNFTAVTRPNVDTLYSSAMLDLSISPLRLNMPAVDDRYVLMAFFDAWSNNFAGVGTQSHGTRSGHYFIAGPNDANVPTPEGYTRVDAPTNMVWIIGRTEVKGLDDVALVNAIQDQYELIPENGELGPQFGEFCVPLEEKTPPIDIVLNLSATEFFDRLARLMRDNPAPAEDALILGLLRSIGIGPEAKRPAEDLPFWVRSGLRQGRKLAQASLDITSNFLGAGAAWTPNPKLFPLGDFGRRYFLRSIIAKIGFGANRGEFAVYQNASQDSDREFLNSAQEYSITFPAEGLPPVGAFWSLTVYAENDFLADNRALEFLGVEKHSVGSNTGAERNPDGSLTVHFSRVPPQGVPLTNWLPIPSYDSKFEVTLRMYNPEESILEGEWKAPAIERVH